MKPEDKDSEKGRFLQELDMKAEKYSESKTHVVAKIASAIPHPFGPMLGLIDSLIADRGSKLATRRNEELGQDLRSRVEKMEASSINMDFLRSEEFEHLVWQARLRSCLSTTREKVVRYGAFVAGSLTDFCKGFEYDKIDRLLNILGSLSEAEFAVCYRLNLLEEEYPGDAETNVLQTVNVYWDELPERTGLPSNDLDGLLATASAKGALREITGTYFDYSGGEYYTTWEFKDIIKILRSGLMLDELDE